MLDYFLFYLQKTKNEKILNVSFVKMEFKTNDQRVLKCSK